MKEKDKPPRREPFQIIVVHGEATLVAPNEDAAELAREMDATKFVVGAKFLSPTLEALMTSRELGVLDDEVLKGVWDLVEYAFVAGARWERRRKPKPQGPRSKE